jgi:tetratricopeptide (TPR) repeat protein
VGLAGAAAFFLLGRDATPEPPALDLAGADPAVVKVLQALQARVRQSPRSPGAWGTLGLTLVAHDFHEPAQLCFAQAERLDAREPRWPYHQGVWLASHDAEAALRKYQRAVELAGPGADSVRLRLAELLLAQGRLEEAAQHFQTLLAHDPAHARAHLGLARVAREQGDPASCRAHLEPALAHPATRKAAHGLLAALFRENGEAAAAEREERLEADLPDDGTWPDPLIEEVVQLRVGEAAQITQAQTLIAQNRVPEALALLSSTLDAYPESTRGWEYLGKTLQAQGEFAQAEKALRRALRLAPDAADLHVSLGLSLQGLGDRPRALASFRTATRLRPSYAFAHYNLGRSLEEQDDVAGAREAYRQALRCKPNYGDAHARLGDLLARSGERAEAVEQLRRAVELNPGDAALRQRLDELLREGKPSPSP